MVSNKRMLAVLLLMTLITVSCGLKRNPELPQNGNDKNNKKVKSLLTIDSILARVKV
ncbi:MAG: hypothetical protein ACN4E2_03570 [Nitrospinota bacterium]